MLHVQRVPWSAWSVKYIGGDKVTDNELTHQNQDIRYINMVLVSTNSMVECTPINKCFVRYVIV